MLVCFDADTFGRTDRAHEPGAGSNRIAKVPRARRARLVPARLLQTRPVILPISGTLVTRVEEDWQGLV